MENKKFKIGYSCKHYFGERMVYAEDEDSAKLACKIQCETAHTKRHGSNTDITAASECGKTCKLKMKVK